MLRRTLSIFIVSATTITALAISVSPASAGKPVQIREHRLAMVCEDPPVTNEFGTAIVSLFQSDIEGPSVAVLYWEAPATPETAEATLRTTTGEDQLTATAEHMEAVIAMEDSAGVPAGNALVSVDLAPDGEPEEGENTREGQRLIRNRSVLQNLVVESGTLTLPGGVVFDLTGCPGGDLTIDVFITQPDAFVQSFNGILVLCDIGTDDYAFSLGASAEEAGTRGEIDFENDDVSLHGESTGFTLTAEQFSATIEMLDRETEESAGDAAINATFTRLHRVSLDVSGPDRHSRLTGWLLGVTGTATIPAVQPTVVDLSSCFAVDGRQTIAEPHPGKPDPEPEE